MSTAVDRARDAVTSRGAPGPAADIFGAFERQRTAIERALPTSLGLTADQFIRRSITLVRQTPKLAECTRESLLGGLMLGAQLGLEFGPLGEAYLVPRWNTRLRANEATFITGYRGIIKLARRSGQITRIEARVVRAGDEFEFAYGIHPVLEHRPALHDRGDIICVYGLAEFTDGSSYFDVLDVEQINAHRRRSAAADTGPWQTDWEAMARKTCIRAMAPYLPLAVEIAKALTVDDTVRTRLSANIANDNTDDDMYALEPAVDDEPEEDQEPPQPAAAPPPAPAPQPPPEPAAAPSTATATDAPSTGVRRTAPATPVGKPTKTQCATERAKLTSLATGLTSPQLLAACRAVDPNKGFISELDTWEEFYRFRTLLLDLDEGRRAWVQDDDGRWTAPVVVAEQPIQGMDAGPGADDEQPF